ncbi:MAG: T9SS type A sorting domain-containing protein [Armatimonadetes bacterium]|nr:T9SS type A sorting domain-containing protein [Armatimonadota bacterium]
MTIRRTAARLAGACAALLVAAAPLTAQQQTIDAEQSYKESPLVQQLEQQIGQTALNFWTAKLSEYKQQIDRTLSPADLETLNRLRVRWSILTSEMLEQGKQEAERVDEDDATTELSIKEEGMEKLTEVFSIFGTAMEMSGRYRTSLDGLKEGVMGDLATFLGQLQSQADRYVAANKNAIMADPQAKRQLIDNRDDFNEVMADLKSEKGQKEIGGVYDFAIEPLIMLFNGADLRALFSESLGLPKPVTGFELPESLTLKQNFPNPATTTTTIGYVLTEPASEVMLRIYDANGGLVRTLDQNDQAAGDHSVTVDVSELATGSYLYHLTVTTAKGEMVYSKAMRVIH